jgi:NDP-sugar pyrophosphorylase family protein
MMSCGLSCLPVVDDQARLCGLHLPHKLVGCVERPNWAVIMAGGRGTRLGHLTQNLPKPMLKVAGRPILERLVLHLVSHGIRKIFLSINYLGHIIEAYFGDGSKWGIHINYLREREAMGTAGSLSLLPKLPATPLLVLNGDLVIESNLGDMLAFHEASDYYATVGIYRYYHQVPFGCLQIRRQKIYRLEEKPVLSKHINTGVYVLSPAAVRAVPRRYFTMVDLLENALQKRLALGAYELKEDWIDVGQRDQLKIAKEGAVE